MLNLQEDFGGEVHYIAMHKFLWTLLESHTAGYKSLMFSNNLSSRFKIFTNYVVLIAFLFPYYKNKCFWRFYSTKIKGFPIFKHRLSAAYSSQTLSARWLTIHNIIALQIYEQTRRKLVKAFNFFFAKEGCKQDKSSVLNDRQAFLKYHFSVCNEIMPECSNEIKSYRYKYTLDFQRVMHRHWNISLNRFSLNKFIKSFFYRDVFIACSY